MIFPEVGRGLTSPPKWQTRRLYPSSSSLPLLGLRAAQTSARANLGAATGTINHGGGISFFPTVPPSLSGDFWVCGAGGGGVAAVVGGCGAVRPREGFVGGFVTGGRHSRLVLTKLIGISFVNCGVGGVHP